MYEGKHNLFIYGSLRDSVIFKSVSGLGFSFDRSKMDEDTLFAGAALLPNYRKVSPDNVYFYAVSNASSRIDGFVIYDVPDVVMDEIDRYEGKHYNREIIQVNTDKGLVWAQAYLTTKESMQKHFGDRFHVNLRHELWLRKRIEDFIERRTRPGDQTEDAKLERRAERELLGTTERDLVISHYGIYAVSDYYLEHELDRPRPSIKHLYKDKEANKVIENYLALVVKQVLFNQLEMKIQNQYRFELDHIRSSERYFKHSVSVLIALQIINSNKSTLDLIIRESLETMPYIKYDIFDYIKYAVNAAGSFFDTRVVRSLFARIQSNFHPGLLPLGAEIELSNLGFKAVARDNTGAVDAVYDGFKYFHDFYLDVLSWKLGGYIDDHSGSTQRERRRGFLELAPGRLNIAGELSRPATADPWLLNQLILEIIRFYDIRPHSLHLSFQLRRNQIGRQKVLPLGFVKCLLVLGGGLEQRNTGRLWVSRMGAEEITKYDYGEELVFARTSKRQWYLGEDEIGDKAPAQATTHIQQYKFIRLDERANYEPLILCLKGLQLACNPADYLSFEQLNKNEHLRRQYEDLKKWSVEPTEISRQIISRFVNAVQKGLMSEAHNRPAHRLHYIDWALSAIDVQLRMFNKQIKKTAALRLEQ